MEADAAQGIAPRWVPSALLPLWAETFRKLWLVSLIANTCMWMSDVAAAWQMASTGASPAMVALVQSASTLPVFLFGLLTGAIADMVDKRRYLLIVQVWSLGVALLLMLATAHGRIPHEQLLVMVFLNGIGMAMRWPLVSAIVPVLIPSHQLSAAIGLNGIAMNASRMLGPFLAGTLIAQLGTPAVFATNAVLLVICMVMLRGWHPVSSSPGWRSERLGAAIKTGLLFVWRSQRMKILLIETVVYFAHAAVLLALLPLVARALPHGGPRTYALLFAAMGAGALSCTLVMHALRRRLGLGACLRLCAILITGATAILAAAHSTVAAVCGMLLGGVSWMLAATSLATAAQEALPDFLRARGMSTYQIALMGALACGAALWGFVATCTGVHVALAIVAASNLIFALLVSPRLMRQIRGGKV